MKQQLEMFALCLVLIFGISSSVFSADHLLIASEPKRPRPEANGTDETDSTNSTNKKLEAAFGVSREELTDWLMALKSLHEQKADAEPAHLNSLFDKLGQLSETELKDLEAALRFGEQAAGLRKAVEVFKYLNRKKEKDLDSATQSTDLIVSRAAKKVLERKQLTRKFLEKADGIKKGLADLEVELTKNKPSRDEIGVLSDARAKIRLELDRILQESKNHPDLQKAMQSYRDALHEERTKVLDPHRKAAVDREMPSFWSHLGSELKRNYLSLDGAHNGLQAAGLIPFLGEAADAIDGALYAAEGKPGEAAVSFASTIPFAGIAVTASRKTVKAASNLVEAAGDLKSTVRPHQISLERMGARHAASEATPLGSVGEAMSEAKWRVGINRSQQPVKVHKVEVFDSNGVKSNMTQEIYEINLGDGAGKSSVIISTHEAGGAHKFPHVEVGVPKTVEPETPKEPIRYYGNKIRVFWNESR